MLITIDTDKDNIPTKRAAAHMLLRMIGDVPHEMTVKIDGTDMVADLKKTLDDFQASAADVQAPPPPPPFTTITPLDADVEIETDDTGAVTSMTTGVTLAPPPPVPVPPGPVVASELDKRGYPWDGRIHASNRAKTIAGEWKYKRGLDPTTRAAIEGTQSPLVSTAFPKAPLPPVPAAAVAPPPPPPPAPTAGVAAPVAGAPSVTDFRSLMQKITAGIQAKKLTDEQVNAALGSVGLGPQDMTQLIGNNLLIQSVNAAIDTVLA